MVSEDILELGGATVELGSAKASITLNLVGSLGTMAVATSVESLLEELGLVDAGELNVHGSLVVGSTLANGELLLLAAGLTGGIALILGMDILSTGVALVHVVVNTGLSAVQALAALDGNLLAQGSAVSAGLRVDLSEQTLAGVDPELHVGEVLELGGKATVGGQGGGSTSTLAVHLRVVGDGEGGSQSGGNDQGHNELVHHSGGKVLENWNIQ